MTPTERHAPMVTLRDNPTIDRMAADFIREHRHNWDTSEAYDDLRQLLAKAGCLGCAMQPTPEWPAGVCPNCGNMFGPP